MYTLEYKKENNYDFMDYTLKAIKKELNIKEKIFGLVKDVLESTQKTIPDVAELRFYADEDYETELHKPMSELIQEQIIVFGFSADDGKYGYHMEIAVPLFVSFNDKDKFNRYPIPNINPIIEGIQFSLSRQYEKKEWDYNAEENQWEMVEVTEKEDSPYIKKIKQQGGPIAEGLEIIQEFFPTLMDNEIEKVLNENKEIFDIHEKMNGRTALQIIFDPTKGLRFILTSNVENVCGIYVSHAKEGFSVGQQIGFRDDKIHKRSMHEIAVKDRKRLSQILSFVFREKYRDETFCYLVTPDTFMRIEINDCDRKEQKVECIVSFHKLERGRWKVIEDPTILGEAVGVQAKQLMEDTVAYVAFANLDLG